MAALSPALIAGLPGNKAIVCVGPPLFPSAASSAFTLVRLCVVAPVKVAPEVFPIRLKSCELNVPFKSGVLPPVLLATIVFLRFVVPPVLKMPPPAPAVLALTVLFVNVSVLLFKMPPPVLGVELPLTVLLVSVSVPLLKRPLPLVAVLPLTVLFVTVTVPPVLLKMPPPTALAVLPLTVLFVTVSVPWLRMPPPNPAVLLLSVLLVILTVAVLLLRMPPPEPGTVPFAMVKSEKVTTPGLAKFTLKTRELLLPEIVNRLAPGPWKVRFLSISNSPVVSVIGLVTWPGVMSKVIVLLGQALAMIPRREPAPLSLLLVTMVGAQLTEMVKLCGPEVSTPPKAVPPLSWSVMVMVATPLTLVVLV